MQKRNTLGLMVSFILILVLITSIFTLACSKTTTSSAAPIPTTSVIQASTSVAPASTSATAPAASSSSVKAIKLVAATYQNSGNPSDKLLIQWGKDFEAKTGGRYTVEVVPGGAVASITESYDALVAGLADIVFFSPAMVEKPFPVTSEATNFWAGMTGDTITKAWFNNIYNKGYLNDETSTFKLLTTFIGPVGDITTVNPINTLADLNGVKLANIQGATCIELATKLGAVSVQAGPPDLYTDLQRGVVAGCFATAINIQEFKTNEFVKYILPIRVSHMGHMVGMNLDTYNKMPDDVKKIVDDMAQDEQYALIAPAQWDEMYSTSLKYFLDGGGKEIQWSDADMAKVNEIASGIWKEQNAKLEAQGVPANKVCDELYNALKVQGVEPADIAIGYTPGS